MNFTGLKGTKYTIGSRIGGGGEGTVYNINEDQGLVIKVYTDPILKDKMNKLVHMTSFVSEELLRFAAWPVDVVRNDASLICGFIMKKLEDFRPLHLLFNPMERKRYFPDKGYNFLVHVARNLAVAFHKLHQIDIIIGDVNEANILVNSTAMVAMIDCDSFQIKNGNRYHLCEVGIPRYTPPELLERGSFENIIRTSQTDTFSLATLIFQLLFLGRAPFTGINPGKEEFDEESAIKAREFAYSLQRKNKQLFPAKHSLQLEALTPGLISAFHEAFEGRNVNRPSPLVWANELTKFGHEIVKCEKSKIHYYPAHVGYCPWCAFKENDNIFYFLEDNNVQGQPDLKDIEKFVNGYKVEKLHIKTLPASFYAPQIEANPIDRHFINYRHLNWLVIATMVIGTLLVCFLVHVGYLIAGVGAVIAFFGFSPSVIRLKAELEARKQNYENLNSNFQTVVKQHNSPSEFNRYNQLAGQLTTAIGNFKTLPEEFNKNKRHIEDKHYQLKYLEFLRQFDVRYYQIPTFGATKKRLIYQNGIMTAADIGRLKKVKITGIGPRNEQILFDWQRQVGLNFSYRPDLRAIDNEIGIAAATILTQKKQLEATIKKEYHNLFILRSGILSTTAELEKKYNELGSKLRQAELDLQVFQKLMK